MADYDVAPELEIKSQIDEATEANDWPKVKELMQKLITLQKEAPVVQATDEELAELGVDMKLLEKERRLREEIKQAEQDGDFILAREKMRELRVTQKLQPAQPGVRIGK